MKIDESRKESAWIELFLSIIRSSYLGEKFVYDNRTFNLEPTLVTPYDFSRKIRYPRNEFERLLVSLDPSFKAAARVEVYRRKKGWISTGIDGYHGMRIRQVKIDKTLFLLPVLSQSRSIGIDTSSIENKITILAFYFIPDYEAAYTYLEKHMILPKTHNNSEFKWSKLNRDYRMMVLEKFKILLAISCEAVLLIETDAVISPKGKLIYSRI